MKFLHFKSFLIAATTLFLFALTLFGQIESVNISHRLLSPESVITGPDGRYYTSNIGTFNVQGDGTIVVIEGDPFIEDVSVTRFATGLNDPLGSVFVGSTLYVLDVNLIRAIETQGEQAGEMTVAVSENAFPDGAGLLNDLTVDADGRFYASDFNKGRVYRIQDGVVEIILDNTLWPALSQPNGLLIDTEGHFAAPGSLLIAEFETGELLALSPEDEISLVTEGLGTPDGLAFDGAGNLYISNNSGRRVFRLQPDHTLEIILNGFFGPADIGFDPNRNWLLVPSIGLQSIRVIKL